MLHNKSWIINWDSLHCSNFVLWCVKNPLHPFQNIDMRDLLSKNNFLLKFSFISIWKTNSEVS